MFAAGTMACVVSVPAKVKLPIVFAPELVTSPARFPVTFPVNGPANAVDVVVPETCNFVLGVVVPIPILDSLPSIVITVVVDPPSFTLKVISVS